MKTLLTTTMALAVLLTFGQAASAHYYNSHGVHQANWGAVYGSRGHALLGARGLIGAQGVHCWRNPDGSITYIPRL